MTLPIKPSIKNVWATSGVKVEPSDAKVNAGWIVERPPHQFQNFLQNRSDQFLKHINEAGIPMWDAVTVYTAGKSYAQGSDGKIYKCLVDGFNENPVGNPTKWMLTFGDIDIIEYVEQAEDSAIASAASASDSAASATTALNTLAVFDDEPPASPFQGRHWTDSDTGKTYEWMIDADGGQWVEVGSPTAVTATAFAAYLGTSAGASLIGTPDGTVQEILDNIGSTGAALSADLASTSGASLIGFERTAIASAIPVDLGEWIESTPLRDIECGVIGNGVADDTLALNILTAAGRSSGRKVVGRVGAIYKISDTVHINCNADFGGSSFSTTTALATVAIKTSGTVAGGMLRSLNICYPNVYTNKADGAVPTVGSIGIQIEGTRNCRMDFNSVHGFEENLQVYSADGTTGYVSYNNFYFNDVFYGSKINIHLKTASTGWVNQCTWVGGQFAQIAADTAAFNTTNIKITKVDNTGNNPPNGHTFFGCSMEGAFTRTIQYSLPVGFVSSYFSSNSWINCRFEAAANMEFNALALYDLFVGCHSANLATYVGGVYPNVYGAPRLFRHTTDVAAIPGTAGFRTASSVPLFQVSNSGTAAALAVGFNNRINAAISGSGDISVFNPGNDTSLFPMGSLRVSSGVPRLEMGAGIAAPANFISWNTDFRIAGHWNPNADITYNLGSSALRYTNVYANNFRPGAGTATWTSGTGTPEGVVTATVGSIFARTDGAANTTLYVKESGAGNTGWISSANTAAALAAGTGASLIGSQYTETGSYLRTQKEINEDWIDVLGFIPSAERAAIVAGTTTYDATANLVAAAVVAIALGKGLRAAYWGKLFCASNADLRGVKNIDIPGPIQMGTSGTPATLTVGGGANASNWTMKFGDVTNGQSVLTVAPPATPVLKIFGLKRSSVTVGSCNYLQLFADSAVSTGASTAYNQIYLNGAQSKVELTDTGTGAWVNENTFHGGAIQRLYITGVGYAHNHNKFNRPVFEGSFVQIVYTNCTSNLIEDGRFEGVSAAPGWTCAANTYLNKIIVSWSGVGNPRADYQVPIMPVSDLGMDNIITTRALMTHKKNVLFSVNGQSLIVANATASASNERAVNAPRFNSFIRAAMTPSLKGFTSGANRLIAVSDRIPVVNGDTVVFDGDFDGSLARAVVYVYDADMNLLTSEGAGGVYFSAPSFSYTSATGSYGHGADVSAATFNGLAGSVVRSEVKYIRVLIYSATGGFFRSLGASLYSRHLSQPSGQEGAATSKPIALSLAGVPTSGFAPEGTPIYDSTARRSGVNVFAWETQATTSLAAGATSITVNTILTAANADIVGILLSDGTTHWTTVSGLSGSTFTIAAIPVGKSVLAGAPVVFNRWVFAGGITSATTTATLTVTSPTTLLADATSAAFTVNLPTAASAAGQTFNIKKIDSSANAVTIDPNGAELIDGASTLVLSLQWQSAQIQSNGTAWYIL